MVTLAGVSAAPLKQKAMPFRLGYASHFSVVCPVRAQGAGCSRPGARLPASMLRPVDAMADSAASPRPGGGGGRAACPPTPLRARAGSVSAAHAALQVRSTRLTSGMSRISLRKHSHSLSTTVGVKSAPQINAAALSRTRAQP